MYTFRMKLECPACKVALEQQTISGKVFWKCPSCNGLALTLPLVRKELQPEVFKDLWRQLTTGKARRGRPCPRCQQPLKEVATGGAEGTVVVDVCRACQMLWFDEAELASLPRSPGGQIQKEELPEELRLAMATQKVGQLQKLADIEAGLDYLNPEKQGLAGLLRLFY
jgi:Zn-finger nucleic acid-binding protein